MIGLVEPIGGGLLYQIKITLMYSDPAIWRRIVVPAGIKLNRLHDVIQRVMPWTNSHLHHFIIGERRKRGSELRYYGLVNLDFADPDDKTLNEKKFTLADLAPDTKAKITYEYDFGDGWEHEIVVEKILPLDAGFKHVACLAGENACPPDDCGGIGGYYNMLEILGDPDAPDHDQLKEWIGGKWDPAYFDLKAANAALKKLKV